MLLIDGLFRLLTFALQTTNNKPFSVLKDEFTFSHNKTQHRIEDYQNSDEANHVMQQQTVGSS